MSPRSDQIALPIYPAEISAFLSPPPPAPQSLNLGIEIHVKHRLNVVSANPVERIGREVIGRRWWVPRQDQQIFTVYPRGEYSREKW